MAAGVDTEQTFPALLFSVLHLCNLDYSGLYDRPPLGGTALSRYFDLICMVIKGIFWALVA